MKREDCLKRANACVNGDREQQYGNPENNFNMIASLWSDYLNLKITALDVACMMSLFKIARIKGGVVKSDNWIDLAGYAACGCEIQTGAVDDDI